MIRRKCAALLVFLISWQAAICGQPELIYKGYVIEGDKTLVQISSSNGFSKWCELGAKIEGFQLKSLVADGNEIVLMDSSGQPLKLKMEKAKVKYAAMAEEPVPLDKLNWAWIKSKENPMRKMPEDFPLWAYENWKGLPDDIKLDLSSYYRAHGWDVMMRFRANGHMYIHYDRLKDPSEPVPTFEQLKAAGRLRPITTFAQKHPQP